MNLLQRLFGRKVEEASYHMLQSPIPAVAVAVALCAASLWPSSVQAEPACDDFLLVLSRKPANLEFVGCKPGNKSQLRALVATYRVRGEYALRVENYFNQHARMAKLRFYCCGWEPDTRSSPREGSLRSPQKLRYEVSMASEETVVSVRKNWRHISWFYVSATLLLEEP